MNPIQRSPKFNQVAEYYRTKLWNKARVRDAVVKGWITAAEYKFITREEYRKENMEG